MSTRLTALRSAATTSIALLAAFGAHGAYAAELGFYVAGFYGDAQRKAADVAEFDALANAVYDAYGFAPESTLSQLGDDTDSGFGMAGGYRLLPNLAFEAAYIDLGKLSYRNDSFGTHLIPDAEHQEPWFQKLDLKTKGFTLSALAILPLTYRWEVYARGGVFFASNELSVYITDFFGADAGSVSRSSTDLLAGVGASFSFAEIYSARIEYQRFFDAGKNLAEGDIDYVSIGVTVTF